jgi:hypothetical protein
MNCYYLCHCISYPLLSQLQSSDLLLFSNRIVARHVSDNMIIITQPPKIPEYMWQGNATSVQINRFSI